MHLAWLPLLAQAEQPPGESGESLGPLLIWLGFMVIWVITQFKQRQKQKSILARKGQQTPEAPEPGPARERSSRPAQAPAEAPSMEMELRDFMSELLGKGAPQVHARSTRPVPARQAQPLGHRAKVDDAFDDFVHGMEQTEAPAPPPSPATPKPPPLPKAPPLPEPVITFDPEEDRSYHIEAMDDDVYGDVKQITDVVDIERLLEGAAINDSQSLINPSNFIVDLAILSVPIMSTQMISQRPIRTKSSRPKLNTKKAFRRAVISRVILSPPKALSDDIFETDAGAL